MYVFCFMKHVFKLLGFILSNKQDIFILFCEIKTISKTPLDHPSTGWLFMHHFFQWIKSSRSIHLRYFNINYLDFSQGHQWMHFKMNSWYQYLKTSTFWKRGTLNEASPNLRQTVLSKNGSKALSQNTLSLNCLIKQVVRAHGDACFMSHRRPVLGQKQCKYK